jgi:hypothetical protein
MALPVQRVTTVIRVNLFLDDFDQAESQLISWANGKASPYETQIASEEANLSFARDRFRLDSAVVTGCWLCIWKSLTTQRLIEYGVVISAWSARCSALRSAHG